MTELRLGIYRHYKGPLYLVLGLAHDANADTLYDYEATISAEMTGGADPLGERTVVVYVGLQLDAAHLGPRLAVRTLDDFMAWVQTDEAEGNARLADPDRGRDDPRGFLIRRTDTGWWIPRFEYLGPELTAAMLP